MKKNIFFFQYRVLDFSILLPIDEYFIPLVNFH